MTVVIDNVSKQFVLDTDAQYTYSKSMRVFYIDSTSAGGVGAKAAPFNTIANAVDYAEDGAIFYLKYGSTFQEELDLGDYDNIVVKAYGTPSLGQPVLDAADEQSSFTAHSTYTDVYQFSWTAPANSVSNKQNAVVFEDEGSDSILTRVSTEAGVDANPGSFHVPSFNPGDTVTITLMASDSGNPASNGKTYRVTQRNYGLRCGDNATVKNIRTMRQVHNDGSLVVGKSSVVRDCTAMYGHVHNLLIGIGSSIYDADALYADPNINVAGYDGIMFVCYSNTGSGEDVLFSGCRAIMQPVSSEPAERVSGFYAHSQSAGAIGTVSFYECEAYYCSEGYRAQDNTITTTERCIAYECNQFASPQEETETDSPIPFTSTDDEWYLSATSVLTQRAFYIQYKGTLTVTRFRCYYTGGTFLKKENNTETVTVTVTDSVMYNINSGYIAQFIDATGTGQTIDFTAKRNVYYGIETNRFIYTIDGAASLTLDSDYNSLHQTDANLEIDGTTYSDVASYIAAEPQDANSYVGDPEFSGTPADREYGLVSGGNADSIGAGQLGTFQHTVDYSTMVTTIIAG